MIPDIAGNTPLCSGKSEDIAKVDLGGEPSFGYALQYDDEVLVDVEAGQFDTEMNHQFGNGGRCSEAPSEVPVVRCHLHDCNTYPNS